MKRTLLLFQVAFVSMLMLTPSANAQKLLGRASIPAETFVDGPTSGQYIGGGDYTRATTTYGFTLPFTDKQPLQGISAIIDGPKEGTYYIMQDNGFGGRPASPDALLHVYAVRFDWDNNKVIPVNFTTGEDLAEFTADSYIRLSDPDNKLSYETVCEMTNYPGTTTSPSGQTVAVHADIKTNKWLTGYDLDIESIRRDKDGNLWFGDELGPFLIKTDITGKVLLPEIRLPDTEDLVTGDYIVGKSNPYAISDWHVKAGIEGMALDTSKAKLYTILEDDLKITGAIETERFINVFDLTSGKFEATSYKYKVYEHSYTKANGKTVETDNYTVNDFTAISDKEFLVMEKDRGAGDARTGKFSADEADRVAARRKKIYMVNLDKVDSEGYLIKTPLVDLMNISDPDNKGGAGTIDNIYTFPMECVEAIHVVSDSTLIVANDNNYPGGSPSRKTDSPDDNEFALIKFKMFDLESDSLALVDIYNAANEDDTAKLANWLTGPLDTWEGVTVDETSKRVTKLSIFNERGIAGVISPSIGKLTELVEFKFNNQAKLRGPIPAEVWNCTKLEKLQIKLNGGFEGTPIPDGIEALTNVKEINFQEMGLSGEFPAKIFNIKSLTSLYFHGNNLTGVVPENAKDATQLIRFYVSGNKLDSPLPYIDFEAANNLVKIELEGNYFTFADVKPYHDAQEVDKFKGFKDAYQFAHDTLIVSAAKGLKHTFNVDITDGDTYNWEKVGVDTVIEMNNKSLVIDPVTDTDYVTYTCLVQDYDVLSFEIRAIFDLIPGIKNDSLALTKIYTAANGETWTGGDSWLSGPVSQWEGIKVEDVNGVPRVTELRLDKMNLSGEISSAIGELTALTRLDIIGNPEVGGAIPKEIYNCTMLKRWHMEDMPKLTGGIPDGIEALSSLERINFEGSVNLGGTIPAELFEITTLQRAYLEQAGFTGKLPETVKKATQLTRFYLHDNKLNGPLPFVEFDNNGADVQIKLTGNHFSFADVKPYHDNRESYKSFSDEYQFAQDTTEVSVEDGAKHTFTLDVTGGETFAWFKNEETTPVATEKSYAIDQVAKTDSGTIYTLKVQSSDVASFEIRAAFVLKVTDKAINSLANANAETFKSYPNPVADVLYIESENSIANISLTSLTGSEISIDYSITDNAANVQTSGLNAGVYFVKVTFDNNNVAVFRVIKN